MLLQHSAHNGCATSSNQAAFTGPLLYFLGGSLKHRSAPLGSCCCPQAVRQQTPQIRQNCALCQRPGRKSLLSSISVKLRAGERQRASAKRVSKEEAAAGEWAALLKEFVEEEDDAESLNKLCNKGVRLMLSGKTRELMSYKDELSDAGRNFTEQDDMPGALFIYTLYKMTEHVIVAETDKLEGIYLEAFRKVFCLLEDSGWKLVREGEEDEDDVNLDDLPLMGYMQ